MVIKGEEINAVTNGNNNRKIKGEKEKINGKKNIFGYIYKYINNRL